MAKTDREKNIQISRAILAPVIIIGIASFLGVLILITKGSLWLAALCFVILCVSASAFAYLINEV